MKTWSCKIGEVLDLAPGSDAPMRLAVARAYKELTGKEADFCFSGWGAELTQAERAVVDNLPPAIALHPAPSTEVAKVWRECLDKWWDIPNPDKTFPSWLEEKTKAAEARQKTIDSPKIKCSTDAEWRRYYEKQCTELRQSLASKTAEVEALKAQNEKMREALGSAIELIRCGPIPGNSLDVELKRLGGFLE